MPNTNYLIQGTTLSGIADAIRSKSGGSDPIAVEDFASDIGDIQTGHTTKIDDVEVDRDLDLSSIIYQITGDIDFSSGSGYTLLEDAAGMGCVYKGLHLFPLVFKNADGTAYKLVVVCRNVSGYVYKSFELTGSLLNTFKSGSYAYNVALADFNDRLLAFAFPADREKPLIMDLTGDSVAKKQVYPLMHLGGVINLFGKLYGIDIGGYNGVNTLTIAQILYNEDNEYCLDIDNPLAEVFSFDEELWTIEGDNSKKYCSRPIVSTYGSSGLRVRLLAALSDSTLLCGEYIKSALSDNVGEISTYIVNNASAVLATTLYGSDTAIDDYIAIPVIQKDVDVDTIDHTEGTCSFVHFKGNNTGAMRVGGVIGWQDSDTYEVSDCWSAYVLKRGMILKVSDQNVISGGNILAYCDNVLLISKINGSGYSKVGDAKPEDITNPSGWDILVLADKTGTAYVEG